MHLPAGKLSLRVATTNVNHHLWRNNDGKFWINYTVHRGDFTKHRVRHSLYTRNVELARVKRDQLLQLI
jgi:hypothetical protein